VSAACRALTHFALAYSFSDDSLTRMQFVRLIVRLERLATVGIVLAVCGCAGYHVGPVKPELLATIQTISVPTFKNMTLEPRSSVLITNEVITRLQNDGTYQVKAKGKADAALKGTVSHFVRRQLRGSRTNVLRTREMEVQLFVDYVLEDANTHVVLAEGRARGASHMFLDPNFQLSEHQSINQAAEEAARDLVMRLTEGIPGQSGISGHSQRLGEREREPRY
jgi:hypothetical protein